MIKPIPFQIKIQFTRTHLRWKYLCNVTFRSMYIVLILIISLINTAKNKIICWKNARRIHFYIVCEHKTDSNGA